MQIVNDGLDEEDETIDLTLLETSAEAPAVTVVAADATAAPCGTHSCSSTLTIVDDDTRGVTVSRKGPLSVKEGRTKS